MHIQLWDKNAAKDCIAQLLIQYPEYIEAIRFGYWLEDDIASVLTLSRQVASAESTNIYALMQLADAEAIAGNYRQALEVIKVHFPELLNQEPVVNAHTVWMAKVAGISLKGIGQEEQLSRLMKAGLNFIARSRHGIQGGYSSGIDDMYFHALLGNEAAALSRLERAIDEHWSMWSFDFPHDKVFVDLFDNSQFQGLVKRHRHFMEQQVHWYKTEIENTQLRVSLEIQ